LNGPKSQPTNQMPKPPTNSTAIAGFIVPIAREMKARARSSDTPETDAEIPPNTAGGNVRAEFARRLERERNEWKGNHDNQVAIKRIIAARPDLKERAPMVEKLMAERNRAKAHSIRQHARIGELESVIRETLMENLHLADGDVCTLKRLKDAIGFDLDDTTQPTP
jgi:hypothetical protein